MLTMQPTQAGRARRKGRTILSNFAAALTLAVAIPLAASNAEAASEGRVDSLSFDLSATAAIVSDPIRVVSEDKMHEKWTSFAAKNWITLIGKVKLDMKGIGKIREFGIYLGKCDSQGPHGCFEKGNAKAKQIMYDETIGGKNSIDRHVSFQLETSKLAEFGLGDAIIARCNAELSGNADLIHKGHSFTTGVPFTVGFDTYIGRDDTVQAKAEGGPWPIRDIDKSRTITVRIPVVCEPVPAEAKAPPKILEADLGVSTSGDTCPKPSTARVVIAAEAPRPVFYKIERADGTTTTADWIQSEIKLQNDLMGNQSAWLHAEHALDKLDPGLSKYRLWIDGWGKTPWRTVNVECPPFKVLSAWLSYQAEDKDICLKRVDEEAIFYANRPGLVPYRIRTQGGLVVTQGIAQIAREGNKYVGRRTRTLNMGATDEMMRLEIVNDPSPGDQEQLKIECLESLSGKLTLQSLDATSCKGEALVAIHTSDAGELPYELECGPGKSWQRKVTAMANKIGVDKVQFTVTNNEQITCVLRTRIAGVLKPLDAAAKTFQCIKPIDAGSSTNLAPDTRPNPQKPDKPGKIVVPAKPDPKRPDKPSIVVVDPPRQKISCANGKVKNGACECAAHFKPVQAGKNSWRCVHSVADPKPKKPIVSEPKILCVQGTVKNGACTCARTEKPMKTSNNVWRCTKIVVDPLGNKANAKIEVKTAPKRTANPKLGVSGTAGGEAKGKTTMKRKGWSVPR